MTIRALRDWRGLALALACVASLTIVPGANRAADDGGFTLNLQQADLRSLVQTVAERTGRNFIVDPRVNAKVTVVSSTPVSDKALYEIFLSVLSVHGYSAVPAGDVTKIVPAQAAKQDAIPTEQSARGGQLVTRVMPVEHVNAAQLVPILRPLLPQEGHLAAYQPTNRLIVTDQSQNIDRLMRIVDRVDQPIESGVEMVRLDHASAEEVVSTLESLGRGAGSGDERGQAATQLAADTRTNSVLISGKKKTRLRLRSLIANLDSPLERKGYTRVLYLEYGSAKEIAKTLKDVDDGRGQGGQSGSGGGGGKQSGEVSIQADESTNSLILTGPPDRLDSLEAIVQQLDIRRAQVLVEAIIAEVSQDKVRELGIQFGATDRDGNGDQPAALTSFSSGGSNIVQLAQENALPGAGLTVGGIGESGTTDFAVLLRALSSDANNNILSTPSLVTLDNQEAEITVGQNVPFVTGQFSSQQTGGSAQNPFQTIERRDIGITLKVKPQINEGNTVKLEIEQEVSSLSSSAQSAADIITNKRSLKTSVLVQHDQTLVLGGLIDESVRTTDERVPLLGDLPVIGRLFRYQKTDKSKQNLMVFLHPRIVRAEKAADRYTQRKYDRMRSEQLERRRKGEVLMIDELPVLPEIKLSHGSAETASQDQRDQQGDGDDGASERRGR
jgi:general secretion pathway protein D